MSIILENLILEVTRNCNLSCEHCLRGCSEDVNMSKEVVDNLFCQVSEIHSLTFSGGEPTLNVPLIEYAVNQIIEKNIPVYSFYVATNGLIVSPELAFTLLKLNAHTRRYYEGEGNQLVVSVDEFHENQGVSIFDYDIYCGLSFFDLRLNDYSRSGSIIAMGSAVDNGLSARMIQDEYISIDSEHNGEIRVENEFYVNVHGNIFFICDYSYEIQDNEEFIRGSVFDNIKETLLKYEEIERKVA